jgi:hypothetical protein
MDNEYKPISVGKSTYKEATHKDKSAQRLKRITITKIQTTMIGALSAIEEHFGELFEDGRIAALYEKCRQQILDNGNNQKRNLDKEFDLYDIELKRYTYKMPIRPMGGTRDGE